MQLSLPASSPAPREVPRAVTGLDEREVSERLSRFGRNEIRHEASRSPWAQLASQFRGAMIWLLIAATVLSAVLGEVADAIAIGAIVILNGLFGFFQEYRSERALAALRSMTAPRARVLRGGRTAMLVAAEVVPGDVLVLEAGDVVAADARVLDAHALATVEAALTGESQPSRKSAEPTGPDAPLAERHDAVFMGTSVANGTGLAEVTATGMQTEFGKIAHLLATTADEETPLQRRLEKVGRTLLWLCLGIVVLVTVLGAVRGLGWLELLLSSVSLAVAAVPEGLAAVVTVALAVGVQRMAARNVLVRRLHAVETLGSTTVICTDKTGTLTTGLMVARDIWAHDRSALLDAAAACSDADLAPDERGGTGDPTEIALLLAAAERGIRRADIERERPRRGVEPFDSIRKRMSIERADGKVYVKGAVEVLVPLCTSGTGGAIEANAEMASRGLRVLAIAVGEGPGEHDLRLLGLVGIADPPRTEAIEAVALARGAGIRPVMITGDHPVTARAIARELGIVRDGEDPDEVVHARATPQQKLAIVRAWKARGAIVAMTGDGVNDAPALREAHIGIAMGRTGTEVTREAADMVLADDNFASIVAAVREGRGIYENIRKTLVYLLSCNAGELMLMLAASVLGLPLPLAALQLLWINLVTDGLPALALVMDPPPPDVLDRPPRRPEEPMLGPPQWRRIALTGALQCAVVLGTFVWALGTHGLPEARNLAFSVLVFAELFRAFAARSATKASWQIGMFTNVRLLVVVVFSAALQIGIHHVPFTQELFGIGTISLGDCLLSVALGLIPMTVLEATKLVRAAFNRKKEGEHG